MKQAPTRAELRKQRRAARKKLTKKQRFNQRMTVIGMTTAWIWAVFFANSLLILLLLWLAGVLLGFYPFDPNLTPTQQGQVIIAALMVDGVLLLVIRRRWLRHLQGQLWRILNIVVLVSAILILITGIFIPTCLLIYGQRGGDYHCDQEIYLSRAINATYPISTDLGGGTAFAIDNHGDLVTAYHVIDGAKDIKVNEGDGKAKVTVVKINKEFDVALLHYSKATPDYLPLTDTYYIADTVYEIGWPDNVVSSGTASVTKGIISREITSEDANNSGDKAPKQLSYIQTDAATNPGNSGGPLVNTCGAVGVVNSSSVADATTGQPATVGINYATSSASVRYALGLK